MSGEQLPTLARVAKLREERAERAWREASRERDAREGERDAAEVVRQRARARAEAARASFSADPASAQARIWAEATRQAATERVEVVALADDALAEARAQVAADRAEHRRREARRDHVDSLVDADRAQRRRAAEGRADDEANDAHAVRIGARTGGSLR